MRFLIAFTENLTIFIEFRYYAKCMTEMLVIVSTEERNTHGLICVAKAHRRDAEIN